VSGGFRRYFEVSTREDKARELKDEYSALLSVGSRDIQSSKTPLITVKEIVCRDNRENLRNNVGVSHRSNIRQLGVL